MLRVTIKSPATRGKDMEDFNKSFKEIADERMLEDDVFRRRDSLQRTPPEKQKWLSQEAITDAALVEERNVSGALYRGRANTLPRENTRDVQQEKVKATKRPREGETELEELRKGIERLTKTIGELVQVTEASTKTKIEIKNIVKKLKRQVGDVNKEWKLFDEHEDRNKAQVESKEMKTVAVQVGAQDIINEYEEKRQQLANKVLRVLKEKGNFNDLAGILDDKWPQEIFEVTEIDGTNQATVTGLQEDFAILMDPSNMEGNKIIERVMLKYNGLAELIQNNDGQIDFLIQTAKVKTRKNEYEENSSAVYFLPIKIDTAGVNDMEIVYNRIEELLGTIKEHPTEKINIVVGDGLKLAYVRKICEYIFAGTNVKVKLLVQGFRSDPKKEKGKREETIMTIKTQGNSYVDMVKKLKENVDIKEIGVKIKKLRKSNKGDLMLTVDGGQNMATALEKEMKSKMDNIQVATRTEGKTIFYILGLDPTTTEDEIKQGIMRETKIRDCDVNVKGIRKGKYEEQTAIIEIPRKQAGNLIKLRKLRIGWTECGIRERIHIQRCFKCLEYGHRTRECESQADRRDECIKCGQTGHKSKECSNNDHCVKCGVEGHRADQIKCPHFKQLIEKMRKQNMQRTDATARKDKRELPRTVPNRV